MEATTKLLRYLNNSKKLAAKSASTLEEGLKFHFVIGNSGCDPDSVVGSILTSVVQAIQINSKHGSFDQDFEMMFSSDPDLELLMLHRFRPVLPLINSVNKDIIKNKRDCGFLNSTFHLGIEELMSIGDVRNLLYCKYQSEITLFDFNYPDDLVKQFLKDTSGRVTTVIDHHAILNQEFIDGLDTKLIESSASCVAVLLRQFRQANGFTDSKLMRTLSSHLPGLVKASCCVIDFDAFQFAPNEKDIRWWQRDADLLTDLQALVGYTDAAKQADVRKMMAAHYSEIQFQSSLDQLMTSDSKLYYYEINHPDGQFKKGDKASIFYAALANTIDGYLKAFGPGEIRDCIAKHFKSDTKAVILLFIYFDSIDNSNSKRSIVIFTRDDDLADRLSSSIDKDKYPISVINNAKTFDDDKDDDGIHAHIIDSINCNLTRKIIESIVRCVV